MAGRRRRPLPSCEAFWLGVDLVDSAARPASQALFAATVAPHVLALGSETPDNWRTLRGLRYGSDGRRYALRGPSGEACAAVVRRQRAALVRGSARTLSDRDDADDVHAVEASLPARAERDLRIALRAAVILVASGPPAPS